MSSARKALGETIPGSRAPAPGPMISRAVPRRDRRQAVFGQAHVARGTRGDRRKHPVTPCSRRLAGAGSWVGPPSPRTLVSAHPEAPPPGVPNPRGAAPFPVRRPEAGRATRRDDHAATLNRPRCVGTTSTSRSNAKSARSEPSLVRYHPIPVQRRLGQSGE
jgi:hypothetical protein